MQNLQGLLGSTSFQAKERKQILQDILYNAEKFGLTVCTWKFLKFLGSAFKVKPKGTWPFNTILDGST